MELQKFMRGGLDVSEASIDSLWTPYADAQATVEALQRERDEWRSNVVAQEARANDLERDCKDLLSDIDGERAKVGDLLKKIAYWEKRHSTYRELAEENMNLKSDELSALQGLVRALQRERDALKLVNETHMKTVMTLSHIVERSEAALDAEREKGRAIIKDTKNMLDVATRSVREELTQLKALVRAFIEAWDHDGEPSAVAYEDAVARARATLDATTPAPMDAAETHDRMFNHADRHPEAL